MAGIGQDNSAADGARGAEQYTTLPEKLAEQLRERILFGEFSPGANIPERETSAELGVSRTPLREALRVLANEGLVEIRPARSPIVANPSAARLHQLFSVTRVLEALAGELACLSATAEEIAALEDIHERLCTLDPSVDPMGFFNTDMDFHKSIVRASANPPLIKTHQDYIAQLWRARFMTSRAYADRDRILHEHSEILSGIRAGDTHWTSSVLDVHLRTASRKVYEICQRNGGYLGNQ